MDRTVCGALRGGERALHVPRVVGGGLGRRPVQSAVQRGPLVQGVAEEGVVGRAVHGRRCGPAFTAPVLDVQRLGIGGGRAEELPQLGTHGLLEVGPDGLGRGEAEQRGGRAPQRQSGGLQLFGCQDPVTPGV